MTPLEDKLVACIAQSGPLRLDDFMASCLMDPDHGYYTTRDPFGKNGDFTTAPEISQIFGELIGLWLAHQWEMIGAPDPVYLVELGPGRGTLSADILRSWRVVPALLSAVEVHLVETSQTLREAQAKRVAATWHDDLSTVPDGPFLLVANEFFDALPIRQLRHGPHGWEEMMVGLADGALSLLWQGADDVPAHLEPTEDPDAIWENCPAANDVMTAIASRLAHQPGSALIVDYGYGAAAPGDSLQAVRNHQYVPVLDRPGHSDLTAHVNFAALAQQALADGAFPTRITTQGAFLEDLGIHVRAQILMRQAAPRQAKDIPAAVRRLVAPDMMGQLFKVMAVSSPGVDLPPGFTAWWTSDE